jgi:CBS domain-containing protein
MKNIDVCSRDVATVKRTASLLEAAELMRERHVGSVVVVDDASGRPAGIITDRDMVIEVIAAGVDPVTVSVGDIMSAPVFTVGADDDVAQTAKAMRIRGVRRVPVVDEEGRLCGIASLDEIIELAGETLYDIVGVLGCGRRNEAWARS